MAPTCCVGFFISGRQLMFHFRHRRVGHSYFRWVNAMFAFSILFRFSPANNSLTANFTIASLFISFSSCKHVFCTLDNFCLVLRKSCLHFVCSTFLSETIMTLLRYQKLLLYLVRVIFTVDCAFWLSTPAALHFLMCVSCSQFFHLL